MKGFDEVYNLLLEHSFRYFGPGSSVTEQIKLSTTWNPNIQPDDNNLIRLVDENLRKDNDAYLNFLYVGFYYIFENLLTKVKFENKMSIETLNLDNQKFNESRFNEEDFRKVMGFIGNLLITERQSLSTGSHDYVELYFQIKKIWTILITKRYFDDNYTIDEIRTKMKKSYAIPQLMKIDQIKIQIENHLDDLDKIYETKETALKHINEFQKDYFKRYFGYIQIGLNNLIKDFLNIISSKFTSIDLLKENLNTIYPTDPFHVLLIEYLQRDQNNTNNLQTETDMLEFLNLIDSKYRELNKINENSNHIDNNLEDSNESNNSNHQPDQMDTNEDDINDFTTNDNNLNDNIDNLISDRNILFNDNSQHHDDLNLDDNMTFGTMSENETQHQQTEHIEEARNQINENIELNESMNENNLIDQNLEQQNLETTELDNQYQQIENLEEIRPNEDNNEMDINEQETNNIQLDNEMDINEQETNNIQLDNEMNTNEKETNNIQLNNNDKGDKFDRVFASVLNLKSKTSNQTSTHSNKSSKELNKKSTDQQALESTDSEVGTRNLTELKGCNLNDSRTDIGPLFNSESDADETAPDFHEISNAFIDNLQQHTDFNKTSEKSKAKSPKKRLIDSDQDELGDLETIKRMEISSRPTTSFFSFDYDPLSSNETISNLKNKLTPTKSTPTKINSTPKQISISNRATLANTPKTSTSKSKSSNKKSKKDQSIKKTPKKRIQIYTSSEEEEEEENNKRFRKDDFIQIDSEECKRIEKNKFIIKLKEYSKYNHNGESITIYS